MAPIQNDQPHDGEKFGFKPFWLSRAGVFTLKYIAMLGDREMASAQFRIVVKGECTALMRLIIGQFVHLARKQRENL